MAKNINTHLPCDEDGFAIGRKVVISVECGREADFHFGTFAHESLPLALEQFAVLLRREDCGKEWSGECTIDLEGHQFKICWAARDNARATRRTMKNG